MLFLTVLVVCTGIAGGLLDDDVVLNVIFVVHVHDVNLDSFGFIRSVLKLIVALVLAVLGGSLDVEVLLLRDVLRAQIQVLVTAHALVWIPAFALSLVSALKLRTMAGMGGRGSVVRHVGRQVHARGALGGESLGLLDLGHHVGAYAAVVAVKVKVVLLVFFIEVRRIQIVAVELPTLI